VGRHEQHAEQTERLGQPPATALAVSDDDQDGEREQQRRPGEQQRRLRQADGVLPVRGQPDEGRRDRRQDLQQADRFETRHAGAEIEDPEDGHDRHGTHLAEAEQAVANPLRQHRDPA
jgi:hypothetical protein